jgi:hypothetical protein
MSDERHSTPSFLLCVGDDKQEKIVNLSQIRLVEKLSDDHVRLVFDLNFTLEVHGKGAMQLLAYCMARSVLVDGTPVLEIWEKLGKATSG